eukprot:scaffold246_cov364-Pavlova_lutheri.AAC.8
MASIFRSIQTTFDYQKQRKSYPCGNQYLGHSHQNQTIPTFGINHIHPSNRRRGKGPIIAHFVLGGKSEYLFGHA